MQCCICTTDSLAVIKYTDKLGKQITEPRCEDCALAVIGNTENTVHNRDELTDISTDESDSDKMKTKASRTVTNTSTGKNSTQPHPPRLLTGKSTTRATKRARKPPYRNR